MSVFLFILLKKLAWVLGGYLVWLLAQLPPPAPVKRPPPWWGLFQPKTPQEPPQIQTVAYFPPKTGRWIEPPRRLISRDFPVTESPKISREKLNS